MMLILGLVSCLYLSPKSTVSDGFSVPNLPRAYRLSFC